MLLKQPVVLSGTDVTDNDDPFPELNPKKP